MARLIVDWIPIATIPAIATLVLLLQKRQSIPMEGVVVVVRIRTEFLAPSRQWMAMASSQVVILLVEILVVIVGVVVVDHLAYPNTNTNASIEIVPFPNLELDTTRPRHVLVEEIWVPVFLARYVYCIDSSREHANQFPIDR